MSVSNFIITNRSPWDPAVLAVWSGQSTAGFGWCTWGCGGGEVVVTVLAVRSNSASYLPSYSSTSLLSWLCSTGFPECSAVEGLASYVSHSERRLVQSQTFNHVIEIRLTDTL